MRTLLRNLAVAAALGVVALAAMIVFMPGRFRLESVSPDKHYRVIGLPFKGSEPHPLDGALRLSIYRDGSELKKQQTSLPFGRDLKIVWKQPPAPGIDVFKIEKDEVTLMTFQVLDQGLRCLGGSDYLEPDPDKK